MLTHTHTNLYWCEKGHHSVTRTNRTSLCCAAFKVQIWVQHRKLLPGVSPQLHLSGSQLHFFDSMTLHIRHYLCLKLPLCILHKKPVFFSESTFKLASPHIFPSRGLHTRFTIEFYVCLLRRQSH